MKKNTLSFEIELDENNVPENIVWNASDDQGDQGSQVKSLMISVWDANENVTKRVDLWTKDMFIDDMKMHYFQTVMTMADNLARSTGEEAVAKDLRAFGRKMAEQMGLIK